MKRKLIFLLNIALLLVTSGVLAQSGTNYQVEWSVMGSAGDQFVSGSSYQMGFTLSQDQAPLISSGSNYQIVQGYWAGAAIAAGYSRYDFDQSCRIDVGDVAEGAGKWRCVPGGCYEAEYDVDNDGDIDILDIMEVARRFGCQCGDACYDSSDHAYVYTRPEGAGEE